MKQKLRYLLAVMALAVAMFGVARSVRADDSPFFPPDVEGVPTGTGCAGSCD